MWCCLCALSPSEHRQAYLCGKVLEVSSREQRAKHPAVNCFPLLVLFQVRYRTNKSVPHKHFAVAKAEGHHLGEKKNRPKRREKNAVMGKARMDSCRRGERDSKKSDSRCRKTNQDPVRLICPKMIPSEPLSRVS